MNIELNNWWSSLTIVQKERVAGKIASKRNSQPTEITYPECTRLWLSLDVEEKKTIHDHCVDAHGYLLPEFSEGTIFNY